MGNLPEIKNLVFCILYNQLKIRFNRFRNILRQSIKDAKRLYFQRIFKIFKHDIKKLVHYK